MSLEAMQEFTNKLETDKNLRAKIDAIEVLTQEEALVEMARVAVAEGFAVTTEEFQELGGELNEEQLEAVAGGVDYLQSRLQQQQQTQQMISNVSNMLHDNAMATIRKIG